MMTDALQRLGEVLDQVAPAAIAVSGGIDSLTLATAAHRRALGQGERGGVAGGMVGGVLPAMFHATSPAVPAEATARTRRLAEAQGWSLEVFDAGEFEREGYRSNPANRCFFCKTSLYGAVARRTRLTILSGTNLDDLGEWRPGLEAAREHAVRHPFVEAGIGKAEVRALARVLGLGALAELPSAPCLSSRIETGLRIEPGVLAMVHEAEKQVIAALGPRTARVRVRAGGVVVELDEATLADLDEDRSAPLLHEVAALARGAGLDGPVGFAPYRNGSAFIRRSPGVPGS